MTPGPTVLPQINYSFYTCSGCKVWTTTLMRCKLGTLAEKMRQLTTATKKIQLAFLAHIPSFKQLLAVNYALRCTLWTFTSRLNMCRHAPLFTAIKRCGPLLHCWSPLTSVLRASDVKNTSPRSLKNSDYVFVTETSPHMRKMHYYCRQVAICLPEL